MIKAYGGIDVRELSPLTGIVTFASFPYVYRLIRLTKGERLIDKGLGSRTVVVQNVEKGAQLSLPAHNIKLKIGDSVQTEGVLELELQSTGGYVTLLVAGTEKSWKDPSIKVTCAEAQYTVSKPWGHEIWYNGQHPGYSLKHLFMRAGNRTSLQYHRLKHETNVLFDGAINLVFKGDAAVKNDAVKEIHLSKCKLNPVTAIDVTPNTLHRIESISDSFLYETATPQLDDVVRVQDDQNRGDGRIATEHQG